MGLSYDYGEEFPYDKAIYFNNASSSLTPASTINRIREFLESYASYGPDSSETTSRLKERLRATRKKIADLINCDEGEVVFTQSTTDGVNFVAGGLRSLHSGGNAVIRGMEHEHPANYYPWLNIPSKTQLRSLQVDTTGYFGQQEFENKVDENTRLVVLSHALFNTGAILPVEEYGEILKEKNIPYFVDSAQSVGCLEKVDVKRIGCDFMSFTGAKWLCGPSGIGVFYCSKESSELLDPLLVGGESSMAHQQQLVMKDMPDRFQAGFRNWSGVIGLEASLDFVLKVGLQNIRKKVVGLAELLREELKRIQGVTLYGPDDPEYRTSIVSFDIQNHKSADIVDMLEKQGIVCGVRDIFDQKIVRVSPHFFNSQQQIVKLVEVLKKEL